MTQTKMKHPVLPTHFGIPHSFNQYAENYAHFRVQEYIENQAKIEMRKQFEKWAITILGDYSNWRESGECELAWQSWQAASKIGKTL